MLLLYENGIYWSTAGLDPLNSIEMRITEINPDHEAEIDRIVPNSGRRNYGFLDLIKVGPDPKRPGILKYNTSRLRELKNDLKPGIYIWSHPDWGIFYIGINAKGVKGAEQRWLAHADKLLNRLRASTGYTRGWHEFSELFVVHSREDVAEAEKDLAQVTITYLPLKEMATDPEGYKVLKKELASIEDQLIDFFNPFANKEYRYSQNQGKASQTLNVPAGNELSTRFAHLSGPATKTKGATTKVPAAGQVAQGVRANSDLVKSQAQDLKDKLEQIKTTKNSKAVQNFIAHELDTIIDDRKIVRGQIAPSVVQKIDLLLKKYL